MGDNSDGHRPGSAWRRSRPTLQRDLYVGDAAECDGSGCPWTHQARALGHRLDARSLSGAPRTSPLGGDTAAGPGPRKLSRGENADVERQGLAAAERRGRSLIVTGDTYRHIIKPVPQRGPTLWNAIQRVCSVWNTAGRKWHTAPSHCSRPRVRSPRIYR